MGLSNGTGATRFRQTKIQCSKSVATDKTDAAHFQPSFVSTMGVLALKLERKENVAANTAQSYHCHATILSQGRSTPT